MRKAQFHVSGYVRNIWAVTVACTALIAVAPGVASASSAPDVVNKKYADASADLSKAGYTAVVSTRIGDDVPQNDCIVVHQQTETTPTHGTKKYLVDESKNVFVSLSCYAGKAAQGEPGYSANDPKATQSQQTGSASTGQQ
jgi:hypothetical protein